MHMCTHVTTCICKNIQYYRMMSHEPIYAYVYVFVCTCILTHVYVYTCINTYLRVFLYTPIWVCVCRTHSSPSKFLCLYVYTHVCKISKYTYIYKTYLCIYIGKSYEPTHEQFSQQMYVANNFLFCLPFDLVYGVDEERNRHREIKSQRDRHEQRDKERNKN